MKKIAAASAALALAGIPFATQAQTSSVSVYGVLDTGLTRVNNIGGGAVVRVDDGVSQGSRLGFRGREDLGDGLEAIFNLEMGVATDTGALRQGGLAFGRAAFVGLADRRFGQVTAGRQFDQMTLALIRFHPGFYGGIYGFSPGDADRVAGNWLDNQITYQSPELGGFKFSVQGAMSENGTSATGTGNAWSAGSTYTSGAFSLGAATTSIKGYTVRPGSSFGLAQFLGTPLASATAAIVLPKYQTAGAGASYTWGQATVAGLATRTSFENAAGRSAAMNTAGASLAYKIGELILSTGIQRARLEGSVWTTGNIAADYYLSKRTDVYATINAQKTSGIGTLAALVTNGVSSSNGQSAVRVGIRHRF